MTDYEQLAERFGRLIRKERAWAGLTQEQLGEAASVKQVQISKFENGKSCPRLDTAVRLLACLGIDPREAVEALD
jgi:ribosome-binding protein aMBF1 (putative translation factor)